MDKKPILFDEAESDSDVEIKTNNEYATHYDQWRQKEEMNRLKTKYGDHISKEISDGDSSSSDDEDDEPTEEFERDFFKTLACLKNKDPKIYDDKVVFFDDKPVVERKKTKKQEPMFLKDYERKMILEKGANFEESDEDMEPRSDSPTYVEQQHKLKESLRDALNDDENDDNQWGGLFSKRKKTKEEENHEDQDYKKWLKGSKNDLENKDEETALKPLKEYWNKPDLDHTEKFLRDYLLNKRYLENEDKNHIPSYEEIIHDSDDGLSEDENQLEKQEEFEHKYNFRFEEPDQDFIKRYPRTMEHSVRKTDDRRKVKRQEIRERKEEEKKQKQEDLKQLKVYKRKEIEEKIKMLKEITGNEEMAFQNNDLDADFDPDEHDKRMQELFNQEYYAGEEGDAKPEFSDFEEELGPWKSQELHCEDDDFNMDADYDPSTSTKKNKKEKRRRRPKNDVEDLPIDKNDEKYEEYMDELYKLDCEDMIGDLPCRFKYRDVLPNDFGLTIEEILLAKDKELNSWCSLKKTMQYRPEHVEKNEVLTYRKRAQNEQIKKKLLPSIYDESLMEEDALKEEQVEKMNKHKNFERFDDNETLMEEEMSDTKQKNDGNKTTNKRELKKNKNKSNNLEESREESDINENKKQKNDGNESTNKKCLKKSKNKSNNLKESKEESDININKKDQLMGNKKQKNDGNETTNKDLKKSKNKSNEDETCKNDGNQVPKEENNETQGLTRRQRKNLRKIMSKTENKVEPEPQKQKQNKKRKSSHQDVNPKKKQKLDKPKISDARLLAYGINPKKYKNKLKYKNKMVPNNKTK